MNEPDPTEPEADLVGQILDHYRVVSKLGEGGMGVVYRAVDERLHREVALKVLPVAFSRDAERRARFLREARAAAAVNHPNIATIHDVSEAEGRAYIAMELLEGVTLRVACGAGAPWQARVGWLVDVAAALHAAHRAGILHRDVKPDNVMVVQDGRVKVLDFGIARRLEEDRRVAAQSTVTQEGVVVGTPRYMAPEQLRDEPLDARTDEFAWGVMAYEVLSGQIPWGETELGVGLVGRILGATPAPLETKVPDLPKLVAAVVTRALEKDRADRFESMADVVTALLPWRSAASPLPSQGSLSLAHDATVAQASMPPASAPPSTASEVALAPARPSAPGWRSPWIAGAAIVFALGAAALVGARLRSSPLPPAAAAAAASATVEAPRATAISDLPLPPTTAPEARAEYAAGIQALRDDNFGVAEQHFIQAFTLDPSMAAAYLRAAMSGASTGNAERKRAEYAKAVTLRAQLTPRDQVLLEALEPLLGRAREDRAEAERRLRLAHHAYPQDVEFLDWLGMVSATSFEGGLEPSSLATQLDPHDAYAWESLGRSLAIGGKADEARRAFETCAAVAPDSSDCYGWMGLLDVAEGRCADFERDARRQADSNFVAVLSVARAMAANGAPEAALRETTTRYVALLPELERPLAAAKEAALVDVLEGHFDAARRDLDRQARALASDTSSNAELAPHIELALAQVQLAIETGDDVGAQRVAREFTTRLPTWTSREVMLLSRSRSLWLARVAAGSAGLSDAQRAKWIDERLAQGEPPSIVWANGWAATAWTPEEAKAALEGLASDNRLAALVPGQEVFLGIGNVDGEVGRVERLAGHAAEALPHLRRAAANCGVMTEPFQHVHALLELGKALEETGDAAGACDAYAKIVAMWGDARPRSVTADAARDARKRLACTK